MKTLIYIISSPRSGSTLLANILGNSSGVFNVGELTSLNGFINGNSRQAITFKNKCSCGSSFLDCSFWKPVLARVSQSLKVDRKDIKTNIFISKSIAFRFLFPKKHLSNLKHQLINGDKAKNCAEHAFSVLDEVVASSGANTLVDSSKNILNLIAYTQFLPRDWNLKIVYISRKPEATAYSVKKAGKRLRIKKYYSYIFNLIKCIHFNRVLKIYLHGVDHISISLEDLCNNFRDTEKAILSYLGDGDMQKLSLDPNCRIRHDLGGSVSLNSLDKSIKLQLNSDWDKKINIFEKIITKALKSLLRVK